MRAAAALLVACGCATPRELREAGSALYGGLFALVRPLVPGRMRAPHGVRALRVRGSIAYLVPVEGGVVVVDPGFDETGAAVRAAAGERRVLAVLITHGHVDHISGAHALGGAPVYAGEEDVAYIRDQKRFGAPAPLVARAVMGAPPAPADLRAVRDGERLRLGGALFRAVALPGHTPGSTGWLYRGVLFTGDGVQSYDGEHLIVSPALFSESVEREWESLRRLRALDFRVLCDAHNGCTEDGPRKVRAAARARAP